MKNLLFQIVVSMAASASGNAQAPVKPPLRDTEHLAELSKASIFGSWNPSEKGPPVVAESLSPGYASKLPDCDRVEVFLLAGDVKKPESASDRFPVRPYSGSSGILTRKELKAAEAAKLCSLWRGLTFDNQSPVLSHTANFGLRFHRADKLVLETTVSFSCGNFYYPRTAFPMIPGEYSWHRFRTGDDAGKALSAFLNSVIPAKHEAGIKQTAAGVSEPAPAPKAKQEEAVKPEGEQEGLFPIPEMHKNKEGFSIQIESRSGMDITCLLVNNTDNPVSFFGYAASGPCYHFQFLVDGKWSDEPQSWLDYGRKASLAPRRCSRFVFSMGRGHKMKVGVALQSKPDGWKSNQSGMVWSEVFEVLKIPDTGASAPGPASPK